MTKTKQVTPAHSAKAKPAISVIVATRNRPGTTIECLESILSNSFKDYEIILIDQSDNTETLVGVEKIADKRIHYYPSEPKGLSWARNYGISKAKAKLLAFTDSDCVADKNWLSETVKAFETYPEAAGFFGSSRPHQPYNHPKEICPCVFSAREMIAHNDPNTLHWKTLGLGNNMSLRKALVNKVGEFKEWLGVGSIGLGGEDSEFIFRALSQKHILMTNPTAVIYHNRWLSPRQIANLRGQYACGLFAFFTYYIFGQGSWAALRLFLTFLWSHFCFIIGQLVGLVVTLVKALVVCYLILVGCIQGIKVGAEVSIKEKAGS